jgi:hypothetical protein
VTEPERKPSEVPYLHVRAPRRVVGVGGEGARPLARLHANRAGLLKLREQVDRTLAADEGPAAADVYREVDGAEFDPVVFRAPNGGADGREEGARAA